MFLVRLLGLFLWTCDLAVGNGHRAILCLGVEHQLAAREVRRYLYEVSKEWTPIIHTVEGTYNEMIAVGRYQQLQQLALGPSPPTLVRDHPDAFIVHSMFRGAQVMILCGGMTDLSTLYAAYAFAEQIGVRYTLGGDVLPSRRDLPKLPWMSLCEAPEYDVRGINPFHAYPVGPDWWTANDYKAISTQMVKMRLNFWTFHSYSSEPLVWVGKAEDINADGTVRKTYNNFSQTRVGPWFNTDTAGWGMSPMKTSSYCCGSAAFFAEDMHGSTIADGFNMSDFKPSDQIAFYNRAAKLLKESFVWAKAQGVQSAVGFEFPLGTHYAFANNSEAVFYDGIFARMKAALPVDWVWLWTQEGFQAGDVDLMVAEMNLAIASNAKHALNAKVATSGWSLKPTSIDDVPLLDIVMPPNVVLSSLDQNVGWNDVDPLYSNISRHSKWVMPWLEDDAGIAGPQLWVNRTLMHARDAKKYNASGLVGLLWRTEETAVQAGAMAAVAWNASLADRDFLADFCFTHFGLTDIECVEIFLAADSYTTLPAGGADTCSPLRDPAWPHTCWSKIPRNNMGCFNQFRPGVSYGDFSFVARWEALAPLVIDAEQFLRYDFWRSQFRYLRSQASVMNYGRTLSLALTNMKQATTAEVKKAWADKAVEALTLQSRAWEDMTHWLQQSVSSTGTLGTLAANEQGVRDHWYYKPGGDDVVKLIEEQGVIVPPSALLSKSYKGESRIFVGTVRSVVSAAEDDFCVEATALAADSVVLHYAEISHAFAFAPMERATAGRGIFRTCISMLSEDFTWYVTAVASDGKPLRFPPSRDFTVVVWPDTSASRAPSYVI